MKEWTASIKYGFEGDAPQFNVETKARFLNNLAGRCAVLSMGDRNVCLTFDLRAPDCEMAISVAKTAADDAFLAIGLAPAEVVQAEVINMRLAEEEDQLTPDFMGVAEVAEYLGVTKQRVAQLAKTKAFPAPVVKLSATPIWSGKNISLVKKARSSRS
jgi:hypothetical protein